MAIHHLPQYLSVEAYAQLCKVSRRSIQNRIRVGSLEAIAIDGRYYIDIEKNPPKKFAHGKFRQERSIDSEKFAHLRAVIPWTNNRNLRSYRFLRELILGKQEAWVIGDEIFTYASSLEDFYHLK